jgi:hypothetical protein
VASSPLRGAFRIFLNETVLAALPRLATLAIAAVLGFVLGALWKS